jgi:putative endonuclease
MPAYVYILASGKNGTLYVGSTIDLLRRLYQHKHKLVPGFTSRYAVNHLVYFETFTLTQEAVAREKRLKTWRRKWKIALIEKDNPGWEDLYGRLL